MSHENISFEIMYLLKMLHPPSVLFLRFDVYVGDPAPASRNVQEDTVISINDKSEQELQDLVSKITTHIKEHYSVKWGAANEDVLVFFSSPWLSPLENVYLWILIDLAIVGLTSHFRVDDSRTVVSELYAGQFWD
ncbi:hypothetical protein RIF29_27635 [Crotalaria pallida]|uniref:DOG1 domain-containing protein n=1 Tax=Crotalaria pallida TaxID=3830 RepID=A0AAN9I5S5_CROPI